MLQKQIKRTCWGSFPLLIMALGRELGYNKDSAGQETVTRQQRHRGICCADGANNSEESRTFHATADSRAQAKQAWTCTNGTLLTYCMDEFYQVTQRGHKSYGKMEMQCVDQYKHKQLANCKLFHPPNVMKLQLRVYFQTW